jgi:hypothetical protein
MCSIGIRIWSRPAPALAVVALSICTIAAIVCLGPDTVASAFVEHLGSHGPTAGAAGRGPVPGLTTVWYAVAIRATLGSRRPLSSWNWSHTFTTVVRRWTTSSGECAFLVPSQLVSACDTDHPPRPAIPSRR